MLFGEALVVSPRSDRGQRAIERIPYLTKRAGHMTAKAASWACNTKRHLTPICATRRDSSLLLRNVRRANICAMKLAAGLEAAGFEPYVRINGNQQFFWFDAALGGRVAQACGAELTPAVDHTGHDRIVLRFVTSWATQPEHIEELLTAIADL